MAYISTRGDLKVTFSESVLWGLSPEGGLLIPEKFPSYSKKALEKLRKMGYKELALSIIKDFVDDIPPEDLKKIIDKSYSEEIFTDKEITPITQIDKETYILELFHGPTLAFKDIALQFLGNVFNYILEKMNSTTNILTATSGDTGSAAIQGVRDKKRLRIFVLTPEGRMSKFQTAQMYSIIDPSVFNIAINGTFDDCQDMVKKVSEDIEFREKYHLGYMNSINWCRVLAQIVYFAKGVFNVQKSNNLSIETKVDVAVPTGNFGDILAGYYAKKMGIPIGQLILATNENNVLDVFFKKGIYEVKNKDDVTVTNSPSMDITSASNFERFIYDIIQDPKIIKELWTQIKLTKSFDISKTNYFKEINKGCIVSGYATEIDRSGSIKEIYDKSKVIIDTHTANGVHVAKQFKKSSIFMLCLATASPIKFEDSIKQILSKNLILNRPSKFKDIEKRPQKFERINRLDIDSLKEFISFNAIK